MIPQKWWLPSVSSVPSMDTVWTCRLVLSGDLICSPLEDKWLWAGHTVLYLDSPTLAAVPWDWFALRTLLYATRSHASALCDCALRMLLWGLVMNVCSDCRGTDTKPPPGPYKWVCTQSVLVEMCPHQANEPPSMNTLSCSLLIAFSWDSLRTSWRRGRTNTDIVPYLPVSQSQSLCQNIIQSLLAWWGC